MTEKTIYAPGTPSWVDLGTPDIDATVAFYSALFGWQIAEGPPEAGGYRMCMLGDKAVAGMGPLMGQGQPSAWSTYVSVADADSTAKAVEGAGGMTFVAPMDVLTVGRMATGSTPLTWPRAAAYSASRTVEESTPVRRTIARTAACRSGETNSPCQNRGDVRTTGIEHQLPGHDVAVEREQLTAFLGESGGG